ncbi:MAG TPA: AMP-binding protein [Pseudonocardiaceae bacterium]|jgi:fatty-acyl-CoA synthase
MSYISRGREIVDRLGVAARSIAVIRRSGLISFSRPDQVVKSGKAIRALGPVAGAAYAAAQRDDAALGLVDERGELTFGELDRRSNALARAFAEHGIAPGSVLGIMARDHRGVVETMLAAGKLGVHLVPMNAGFSGPQLRDIVIREDVGAIVHDEEFTDAVAELPDGVRRFLAWTDSPHQDSLEQLIADSDQRPLPAPVRHGGLIILTSGTQGTPKGAPRKIGNPLAVAQLLDRIPLRAGESTVLGAPLYHGTGLSQLIMSFALGSACVLSRRFDPLATLRSVERYRAGALVIVPTMLRRLVDLPPHVLVGFDTSSLRIVLVAGSALPPDLGNRAMVAFGDVIHNMYGSTEHSIVTVATPEDWKAAPGTVGRPPIGTRVVLLDEADRPIVEPGVTGRIFAGSDLVFDGYTDGGRKETIDGVVACGDLGHFDADGRLFIDGREDDMIVSGGENVYPVEVENLIHQFPGVHDAAVIGVPDEEFGQRLLAYVVPEIGVRLDTEVIREYVRSNLARYKVPREIVLIDEIPVSSTGKPLKRVLAGS